MIFSCADAESKKSSWVGSLLRLVVEVAVWQQAISYATPFVFHGVLKSQKVKGMQFVLQYTEEGLNEFTSQVLVAGVALCILDFAWTTYGAHRQHGKKVRDGR